jgi:hypothetical protein
MLGMQEEKNTGCIVLATTTEAWHNCIRFALQLRDAASWDGVAHLQIQKNALDLYGAP